MERFKPIHKSSGIYKKNTTVCENRQEGFEKFVEVKQEKYDTSCGFRKKYAMWIRTLKAGEITNVKDGSSLKRAYGDMFGKVGNALVGNQMTDKNCVNFTASQYNSVTMGNEMKPDSLLKNWNPAFSVRSEEHTSELQSR